MNAASLLNVAVVVHDDVAVVNDVDAVVNDVDAVVHDDAVANDVAAVVNDVTDVYKDGKMKHENTCSLEFLSPGILAYELGNNFLNIMVEIAFSFKHQLIQY